MCWGKILSELLNFSIRLKNYLFFDPFAWLAESLRGQPRGWDAYKILKIKQRG